MPHKKSYLRAVDVFKNLSDEILEKIDQIKVEKRYAKNEIITREGEHSEDIRFVKTGRVRSVRYLSGGQQVTLTTIGPNIAFGICCYFSEKKYHCDTLADTDSVVVRIPMREMNQIMQAHPEISYKLIENLSSRLHIARRMQTVDHERLDKRLLYILLMLKREFGNVIPVTRKQIAEMAGITVRSCVRQMKMFEKQKLFQSSRGKIVVVNLSAPWEI